MMTDIHNLISNRFAPFRSFCLIHIFVHIDMLIYLFFKINKYLNGWKFIRLTIDRCDVCSNKRAIGWMMIVFYIFIKFFIWKSSMKIEDLWDFSGPLRMEEEKKLNHDYLLMNRHVKQFFLFSDRRSTLTTHNNRVSQQANEEKSYNQNSLHVRNCYRREIYLQNLNIITKYTDLRQLYRYRSHEKGIFFVHKSIFD